METNKFRTSGVIDESTYQEINKVAFSRRFFWFTRIAAVVMTILALLMFIARELFPLAIFTSFAALFVLWPKKLVKSTQETAAKRLREAYPAGYIQMETWFTDEGMAVHNLSDGAQLVLSYGTLQKVAETERYFYVSTKANQFNLVFKNMLTPEQKQSILPFLKEKCPQIKVVK